MSVEVATATVFPPVNGLEDGLQAEDTADEHDHEHAGHQGIARSSG